MISVRAKTRSHTSRVVRKAKQTHIKNLGHAGALLRLRAIRGIRKRKQPSMPGQPPHTQTRRLPRAIKYAVDDYRQLVVIGPAFESFGVVGKVHELGGRFRGALYPKRPFMGPALEQIRSQLPKLWRSSIR